MSAFLVARSATGPGNPYWKSPAGSTGDRIFWMGIGGAPRNGAGAGTGTEAFDVADADVDVDACDACAFLSDRFEYMAAVTPAPVAAEKAAIIAMVALDMLEGMWERMYMWVMEICHGRDRE